MKEVLKQLPPWFRHLLGLGVFLAAVGLPMTGGRDFEMLVLAGLVLGLAAWIYLGKAGQFRIKEKPPKRRLRGEYADLTKDD